MLGSADIKVRPLKLALMVDPNSALQVREAIAWPARSGAACFPDYPRAQAHACKLARWAIEGTSGERRCEGIPRRI